MKEDNKKEFVCRQCYLFLDSEDFLDGACPECGSDENIFHNDLEN